MMKVLWFSVTPSLFSPQGIMHNAGGWIASLQLIVMKEPSIELAVAFNYNGQGSRSEKDGVVYYPIESQSRSIRSKILGKNNSNIEKYLHIIHDFKPDIIQIFGSENEYGEICKHTSIPVVIHMQGCLPPYQNALFPVDMNQYDFIFTGGLSLIRRWVGLRSKPAFARSAQREVETIKHCRFFMGRTEWDHNLIKLYHPEANYYHVEEALRDSFWNDGRIWKHQPDKHKKTIISVISNPWYKGYDLILKTAKLLKEECELDFEWQVYGFRNVEFFEKKYNIQSKHVNVRAMGVASQEELADALCSSDCYIHPSYIDNSPNSVCEAQILGLPVIATNVGGVSSIIEDGKTGLLVPANDPFTLAVKVKDLLSNPYQMNYLSSQARTMALRRHNSELIRDSLLSVYEDILSKQNR